MEHWLPVLGLFISNMGLILWMRSESRSDWRHLDTKTDAIIAEMKDFHGRLERQDAEFKAYLMREK